MLRDELGHLEHTTWFLPLNTGLSESSALIMVRFFLSWQPFLDVVPELFGKL
jgi:hypothetical protein